jgi:hypothetical protein
MDTATPDDSTCLCPAPDTRCPVHFRIARGWGARATSSERGRAHLAMAQVTSGDPEPGIFTPEIRDAAAYLPELIADLLIAAEDLGTDPFTVLRQAMAWRREERARITPLP